MKPLLLGVIYATPGALHVLKSAGVPPSTLLARHAGGDWGNISPDDERENRISIERGYRVLSSYLVHGEPVWIITEADRSSTTLLLPSEY